MKKTTLLLISTLFYLVSNAQILWDDYDNEADITYGFRNGVLNENFANPAKDTVNPSDTCARYARSTEQYDVMIIDPNGIVLDASPYVDGSLKMSMKVRGSFVGDTIQITLEDKNTALPANYPIGRHSEYIAVTTTAGQWEELEFTFVNRPDTNTADTSVSRMVILFRPNSFDGRIYLIDDLMGPFFGNPCDTVDVDVAVLEDFECQRNISYNFVNGENSVVLNPLKDDVNNSKSCGKITKWLPPANDGAFGGKIDNPFTILEYKTAHISLYDPSAPQDFLMILRDETESTLIEHTFTTSSTTGWEEFSLDLSGISPSASIEDWVLLINPATDTEDSIYYDNFRVSNEEVDPGTGNVASSLNDNIKMFPNPVQNKLTISSDEEKISTIKIVDIYGRMIESIETNAYNYTISTTNMSQGTYIVSVMLSNGEVMYNKILK